MKAKRTASAVLLYNITNKVESVNNIIQLQSNLDTDF